MVPRLLILSAFIAVGAIFANERHTLSRVTSTATLFVLGAIALKIGHSAVPDAYPLAAAFCIATLGAQSFFYRKPANLMYSLIIVVVSLILVATLTYGATVLGRMASV